MLLLISQYFAKMQTQETIIKESKAKDLQFVLPYIELVKTFKQTKKDNKKKF